MTHPELRAALLAEEAAGAQHWYYLSFASDTAFLGGAFIRSAGPTSALLRAAQLGLIPDKAEAETTEMDEEEIARIPVELRECLLSESCVRALGGI